MKANKLFLIGLCTVGLQAQAYDFEVGGIYYQVLSAEAPLTVEVVAGDTPYAGEVSIPASVVHEGNTYAVEAIGDEAFRGCAELTAVTLPEGLKKLGTSAFHDCTDLTSIIIPEDMSELSSSCFQNDSSLVSVQLPQSLTKINSSAFRDCHVLVQLNIPSGITSIGGGAFMRCKALPSINLPENLNEIGSNAFEGCSSFKAMEIPGTVKELGSNAFIYCDSLETVILHEGVKKIGGSAFTQCKRLTQISLPSTLTTIGGFAFSGCNTLPEITLPESMAELGNSVFEWCKFEKITVLATTPPVATENTFKTLNLDIPVYVPQESLEAYQSAEYWNAFTNLQSMGGSTTTGLKASNMLRQALLVQGREVTLPEYVAEVQVYDASGCHVLTTGERQFTLPQAGLYILRSGNESVKVAIK